LTARYSPSKPRSAASPARTIRTTIDGARYELGIDEAAQLPIVGVPRERADAAANRVRILEAARRVLAERGAEGTSIDAVANEAGVGKGTVFRRFGDRSGLFQALADEHLRTFQDAFMFGPPPLGPGAPPEQRLAAFLEGLLDLQDDHLELILALERERWKAPIGGYIVLSLHVEGLIREISPDLDAGVTAQLLLNAVNVNVVRFLRLEAGVDLAAIKASVNRLVAGLARGA
jgi:AcrR family transcriptional regulator